MAIQTRKQEIRQRFGFYMEDLLAEYFITQHQPAFSHNFIPSQIDKPSKERFEQLWHKLHRVDCLSNYLRPDDMMLSILRLLGSNRIELLRFRDGQPIISEVKSAIEVGDYRIELTPLQLEVLSAFRKNDITVSLIYCIALTEPRFIEVPFTNIESDLRDRYLSSKNCHRIRIPQVYRVASDYTIIPNSGYSDLASLCEIIKQKYPTNG